MVNATWAYSLEYGAASKRSWSNPDGGSARCVLAGTQIPPRTSCRLGAPQVGRSHGDEMTRAEVVYREIRERIAALELQPGVLLTETRLATELGVSKTPIREALRRLQAEKLVELNRGSYCVAPVTLQDVRDFLGLRALLEIEAVRLAACRAERGELLDDQVERLRALSTVTFEPSDHDDVKRFLSIDQEFHVAVGVASGNSRLADTLASVLLQYQRVSQLGTAHRLGAFFLSHDHVELVEAIVEGRVDDAVRLAQGAASHRERNINEGLLSHPSILAAKLFSNGGDGMGRG